MLSNQSPIPSKIKFKQSKKLETKEHAKLEKKTLPINLNLGHLIKKSKK